jgi:hypothetical protein
MARHVPEGLYQDSEPNKLSRSFLLVLFFDPDAGSDIFSALSADFQRAESYIHIDRTLREKKVLVFVKFSIFLAVSFVAFSNENSARVYAPLSRPFVSYRVRQGNLTFFTNYTNLETVRFPCRHLYMPLRHPFEYS